MASGGDDASVWVWDAARPHEPRPFKGHTTKVVGLAFSPDGSRLATGSYDSTLRVWDVVAGGAPRVFTDQAGNARRMAFSPDGARLASGGRDGIIRLRDWTGDGAPLLLKGHTGRLACLTFSPDGARLACGAEDGTIRIYDGQLWTPARQVVEEARGLVEGLFARPLLKADVIPRLHACKGISDETRRQALALADGYRDDASRFNQAGRNVVRWRDAPPALYARALDWTQTACRLAPDDGACLTTLAAAQYRVGRDADALATLARAEPLNRGDDAERAVDLAFAAMAHRRLGHKAEAAAALARLRDAMTTGAADRTEQARALRAEAEALAAP